MLEDNFWQDKVKSQKIIKEKKFFEDLINSYNYSENQIKDLNDLYELALFCQKLASNIFVFNISSFE